MSAAAAHGEHASHSRIPYYFGVALRLAFDAGFTFVTLGFLAMLGTVQCWFVWPVEYATEGWEKILHPGRYGNAGIVESVFDNMWSWATPAFMVSIVIATVIAFLALALFKQVWLGLGTTCAATSLMCWFIACWGFQILGPLLPVAIVALIGVAVVIGGAYWLLKFLWGLGKENAH